MGRGHKNHSGDAFYRSLGRSIRAARVAAGKSQGDTANHLDLTFQQIQKYENGANRIPIDRLVSLAEYLKVPLSEFVSPSDKDAEFLKLADKFQGKELYAVLECWQALKDRTVRAAMLNLLRTMAALKR